MVTQAGMEYAAIGIDWNEPTREDIARFFSIMDANTDKDILVHCVANYRASALYYLYQLKSGVVDSAALQQQIMQPWGDLADSFSQYPQWQVLIEQTKESL